MDFVADFEVDFVADFVADFEEGLRLGRTNPIAKGRGQQRNAFFD